VRSQKELIREVVKGDSWLIIVLDACRYDFFEKAYREFLEGELLRVRSANSTTPYWLKETWTGYYDAVYVSANPFIVPNPPERSRTGDEIRRWLGNYNPRAHFKRIVPLYLTDWDEELGTVRPEVVVRRALENLYPRMVVHFLQPHYPYIGRKKILGDGRKIVAKIRRGEIGFGEVLEAYTENLRLALRCARQLIDVAPHGAVAVTSDHGEILRPDRVEHPPNTFTPELIVVPWLWVRRCNCPR